MCRRTARTVRREGWPERAIPTPIKYNLLDTEQGTMLAEHNTAAGATDIVRLDLLHGRHHQGRGGTAAAR